MNVRWTCALILRRLQHPQNHGMLALSRTKSRLRHNHRLCRPNRPMHWLFEHPRRTRHIFSFTRPLGASCADSDIGAGVASGRNKKNPSDVDKRDPRLGLFLETDDMRHPLWCLSRQQPLSPSTMFKLDLTLPQRSAPNPRFRPRFRFGITALNFLKLLLVHRARPNQWNLRKFRAVLLPTLAWRRLADL